MTSIREQLLKAAFKVEGAHHFHGEDCICGFSSSRARMRTEHITQALLDAAGLLTMPPQELVSKNKQMMSVLRFIEPTLSLLHHRGLIDSEANRADVSMALDMARSIVTWTDMPCPVCSGEQRETVGMVCQTCGTDYGKPEVVVLCGSTRFMDSFRMVDRMLTIEGCIVLQPGVFGHQEEEPISDEDKAELDALHLRKIDMADRVYVVNAGGYIGESTTNEIAYAERLGKPISYLYEPPNA